MKKSFLKYSCAITFCIPSFVFAGGTESVGGGPMGGKGSVAVKDSADQTKKENDSAKTVNYIAGGIETVTGAGMIIYGSTRIVPDVPMITMGVMMVGMGMSSFAQGAAHGKAANQAGLTGFNTDGYGNIYGGANSDPYLPDSPYSLANDPEFNEKNQNSLINRDPALKQAKRDLQKLVQMGILDPKKGTIKAGDKTYKIKDFASPESMAAAGLPKGAIDGAMAMSKDVDKKTADKIEKLKLGSLTPTNGFDEGGGGGKSASDDNSQGTPSYAAGAGVGKADLTRDPSNFAGMQKNYNGEPIGVAADSIFLMMNRRYKVKDSQESFFSEAELALKK